MSILTAFALALAAFLAWIVSTVSGGGGSLLLIPVVTVLLGASAVAPVVTLTAMVGSPARILIFREHIDWRVVRWYLPGGLVGGVLGAVAFARLTVDWLQIVIALFLVSTAWQYRFGKRERTFRMRAPAFLPLGAGVGFLSGLVGATGPILNPFYLNYGAVKEQLIVTKSVNAFFMHLAKVGTYATLGALSFPLLAYGLIAGFAAVGANWVGKHLLERVTATRFRQLVIGVMVVSGLVMLWEQRAFFTGILA